MANEELFQARLAASSFNAAQPDPNASLGGFQASTLIADVDSQLTGVVPGEQILTDTALPASPDLVGWWIQMVTGASQNEVRRIVDWNGGIQRLTVDRAFTNVTVGDYYQLFQPNGFFSALDAAVCRDRSAVHRLAYMRNETGGLLSDVRVYVQEIQAGPLNCEVAMATTPSPQLANFDVDDLASQTDTPPIRASSGFGSSTQQFGDPRSYVAANGGSPFGSATDREIRDVATLFPDRPIWIRLSFDDDAPLPIPAQCVFQVFVESAGGTASSFLIVVDVEGVPEEVVGVVDRIPRIGGGARLSALSRDSVSEEVVPGRSVNITIDSGPGSLNPQDLSEVPEDGSPVRRVYVSPTDPAQAGQNVTFDFEVS